MEASPTDVVYKIRALRPFPATSVTSKSGRDGELTWLKIDQSHLHLSRRADSSKKKLPVAGYPTGLNWSNVCCFVGGWPRPVLYNQGCGLCELSDTAIVATATATSTGTSSHGCICGSRQKSSIYAQALTNPAHRRPDAERRAEPGYVGLSVERTPLCGVP
jgi:hypothetical protein